MVHKKVTLSLLSFVVGRTQVIISNTSTGTNLNLSASCIMLMKHILGLTHSFSKSYSAHETHSGPDTLFQQVE
jgi:hypothetical protein